VVKIMYLSGVMLYLNGFEFWCQFSWDRVCIKFGFSWGFALESSGQLTVLPRPVAGFIEGEGREGREVMREEATTIWQGG